MEHHAVSVRTVQTESRYMDIWEASMRPAEVILSLVVALITTTVFAIITYFYRLALPEFDDVAYNTLYNMLEVTADKVSVCS